MHFTVLKFVSKEDMVRRGDEPAIYEWSWFKVSFNDSIKDYWRQDQVRIKLARLRQAGQVCFPMGIVRRIPSVLKPRADGRLTPGSATTSYSSLTTPLSHSQCTRSPVRKSITPTPQCGSASCCFKFSSSANPWNVRFSGIETARRSRSRPRSSTHADNQNTTRWARTNFQTTGKTDRPP